MSRLSDFAALKFCTRGSQKKRRKLQRRNARHHLMQQLERRDHPGSMLDIGLISLLGDSGSKKDDPVAMMLDTAERVRNQRAEYERLINAQALESTLAGRRALPELSKTADRHREPRDGQRAREQRAQFHNRLLELLEAAEKRHAVNPLLDSVSESQLGTGLDQPVGDQAESGTGTSLVDPTLEPPNAAGAAEGGGGGGARLTTYVTDSAGASMGASVSNNSDGGGGEDQAVSTNDTTDTSAASPTNDQRPDASEPGEPREQTQESTTTDHRDQESETDAEVVDTPVVVPNYTAAKLLDLAGTSDAGPVVEVAETTDHRGAGRFFVSGQISSAISEHSKLQVYAVRGGQIRSLGEAEVDREGNDAGTFRGVGIGKVNAGDAVFVHAAPPDGSIGLVSELFTAQRGHDADRDGVSGSLERLAQRGDGNRDQIPDARQRDVATLPDARRGKPATIDAHGVNLSDVRTVPPIDSMSDHRLPLGLFEFQLTDVPVGSVQTVDIHLPDDEPVNGYFKENPETGRLREFFFDGTTGAVRTEFGFTLYLQDGGRGDEDGIANGVIVDPGGPGYAGSITVGDIYHPLNAFTEAEYGGSVTGQGSVNNTGAEVLVSEGDSLLVMITQSITVPQDPSWLIFGFEAYFDETATDQINDAFEVALLDSDGYSVVPVIEVDRDSYFNITESVGTSEADNTYHYRNHPDDYLSGFVDLDISGLLAGQELSLVMRLVNNDGDTGSWFRITSDRPIPEAINDVDAVDHDTVLVSNFSLLENDDDGVDEGVLDLNVIVESVTQPANGTVVVEENGQFTYTPNSGFHGQDSFTYFNSNGLFSSEVAATVDINVHKLNLPPIAVDDDFGAIDEDTDVDVSVLANDSDPDIGDTLAVTSADGSAIAEGQSVAVANGSVELLAGGIVKFTPSDNYAGNVSFTYTISDGEATATATVRGTVNPIQDDPTVIGAIPDQASIDAETIASIDVSTYFADVDQGETFTFTASGLPDPLAINSAGVISGTLTANASATSPYTVTITATDSADASVSQDFTWTVGNPAPIAADDSVAVDEGASVGGSVLADNGSGVDTDPDGDLISVTSVAGDGANVGSAVAGSAGGTFTIAADGSFTFDSSTDFESLASGQTATSTIEYTLSDSQSATDTAIVTVTVTGLNDDPTVSGSIPDQVDVDGEAITPIDVSGFFADADAGDTMLFTAGTLPTGLTISAAGIIGGTLASNASANSPYTVTVTATDSEVGTVSQNLTWTVSNLSPLAADDAFAVNERASIGGNVLVDNGSGEDVDPDLDTIVVSAVAGDVANLGMPVAGSGGGTFTIHSSGSFTFNSGSDFGSLAAGQTATSTIVYTLSDSQNATDTAWVTVTITGANDDPTVTSSIPDQTNVDGETIAAVDVSSHFADIDSGQTLTFDADALPGGLDINVAGLIKGMLDSNASAISPYTVTVTATDSDGAAVSQYFTWTVTNPSPIASDDAFDVDEGGSVAGNVSVDNGSGVDSDPDGDLISVTEVAGDVASLGVAVSGSGGGTFTIAADGSIVFDAGADFESLSAGETANSTIEYTLADSQGATDTATVTVTVTGINTPPVAIDDAYETDEDVPLVIAAPGVLNNDSDADLNDVLLSLLMAAPDHGDVVLNADGSFTYTPDPHYHDTDQFTYRVFDGEDYSGVATVDLTIHSVNDIPIAVNDGYVTDAGVALNIDAADGLLDNDYDNDGDSITVNSTTAISPAGAGTLVTNADGSIVFIPASGFDGQVTFDYAITDGIDTSLPGTVTITVNSSQTFGKFYVADHNSHQVYRYDDSGSYFAHWDYDTSNRARGATANAAGDTLWTVTAGHDVVVYTSDGTQLGKWQSRKTGNSKGNLHAAEGIATNGSDIWLVDRAKRSVLFYPGGASHLSGNINAASEFDLHKSNRKPSGLTTDGTNLYVLDDKMHSPRIYVYSLSGQHLGNWKLDMGSGQHHVQGVTTNPDGGTELWVLDRHSDQVYYFPYGTTYLNGEHDWSSTFDLHVDNDDGYGIADPPPVDFTSTITWTGLSGGEWSEPNNWTDANDPLLHRVPDATDYVLIDIPGGDFTVNAAGGYDINFNPLPGSEAARLYAYDPILIGGDRSLSITGESEMDRLQLVGGTLQSDGDLTILTSLDWDDGTLKGTGVTTLAPATGVLDVIGNVPRQLNAHTLIVEGDANLAGRIDAVNSPTLDLRGTTTISGFTTYTTANEDPNNFDIPLDAFLINSGQINIQIANATHQFSTDAIFTNQTAIHVISGQMRTAGDVDQLGTIHLDSGTKWTIEGKYFDGLEPIVDDKQIHIQTGSLVDGGGDVEVAGGDVHLDTSLDVTGEIKLSGGKLLIDQPISLDSVQLAGGTLVDVAGLELTGTPLINSDVTLTGTATTRMTGVLTIDNFATARIVDHTLRLEGDTAWLNGELFAEGTGQIVNQGHLTVTGIGGVRDQLLVDNPGFAIDSGALFTNEGQITHNGTGYFSIDTPLVTSGLLTVAPGNTLSLGATEPIIQTAGTFTLQDATLQLSDEDFDYDYNELVIDGGEFIASGQIIGDIENYGDLRLFSAPATLQVDGNFTQGTSGVTELRIDGTTAGSGHDQVQVTGTITLDGQLNVVRDVDSAVGDTFTLFTNVDTAYDDNTSQFVSDPNVGTFIGKEEWAPWVFQDDVFRITHVGDTGNEVVLHHTGPGITIHDLRKNEGHFGQTIFQIPVTLDASVPLEVSVDYTTVSGAAIGDVHYQTTTGTLTFAPGESAALIDVPVFANFVTDSTRDFYVQLSSATEGTIFDDVGQVNIVNDDYSEVPDNRGVDFWLAVPENHNSNVDFTVSWQENNEMQAATDPDFVPDPEPPHGFFVNISSEIGASGTITAASVGFLHSFTVAAGETIKVRLPDELEVFGFGNDFENSQIGATDVVTDLGIRVQSDNEIAVYGLAVQPFTTDAYMALPTDVLGTRHILTSQEAYHQRGATGHPIGSQFQVIGAVDNTRVDITATADLTRIHYADEFDTSGVAEVIPAGQLYSVYLDAGEVYSLRATRDGIDYTGTMIDSSEAVSVLSGNTCADVPEAFGTCDILVEQIPPVSTWGTDFIVNPLETRNVDRLRVVAAEDNTTVNVDGQDHFLSTTGEYFEIDIFDPAIIHSDKPIQATQFSTGSDYTAGLPGTEGDPFMMVLPPTQQFQKDYTVSTTVDRNDDSFIGLVVPDSIVGDVFLDGVPIDSSEFTTVGTSGFSVASIAAEDGSYRLNAPLPFGVTVYGFSFDESYGYVGGQAFTPIDVSATIDLTPEYTLLHVNNQHVVTASVTDQDGNALAGVRVDYTVDGPHASVGSVRTDALGTATIEVDGLLIGTDTITATAIASTDIATVEWFSAIPSIEIVSPDFGFATDTGQSVLISGHAASGSVDARIVSLTIDGQKIETVDAAGNFFTSVDLPFGTSSYTFEVVNSLGISATTTHDLEGTLESPSGINLDSLIDVSAITDVYAVTSFDERIDMLYADLRIENVGQYAIQTPFLVGVTNVSDPSVEVSEIDGYWNDGTPYYDLSDLVSGGRLEPGQSTSFDAIKFHVPQRIPFTYDLVLLGSSNEAPRFTSTPVVNARGGVGAEYSAPVAAVDLDSDTLSFDVFSGPAGMTISDSADGTAQLDWTGIPADTASFPVTLRVEDDRGASALQSFVVSVVDGTINRPPVFVSQPVVQTYADGDYSYDANTRDVDGDPLDYSLSVIRAEDVTQTELAGVVGSGAAITIDPESGLINWNPTGSDGGDYDVVVTADDGRGGVADQRYTLVVDPVAGNYPPVFTSAPVTTVNTGISYNYGATAIDPDNDSLSFALVSGPVGANVTTAGLLTFAVPAGSDQSHRFVISVSDGQGHTVEQAFTLVALDSTPATLSGRVYHDANGDGTFIAADDTPLDTVTVYLDANENFQLDTGETTTLTDSNGQYSIASPAGDYRVGFVRDDQWATVAPAGLVHIGTAIAAQNVSDLDFVVAARPPLNTDPEITTTPPLTAEYLQPFVYDVNAVDAEGDTLRYTMIDSPEGATIDEVTGLIRWLPTFRLFEVPSFTVRVTDGRGGTDRQSFFPELSFNNEAPTITSTPSPVAAVDVPYQYDVVAVDPEGDLLVYSLDPASEARGASIDPLAGVLTWTPIVAGSADFVVTATDSRGALLSQGFTVIAVTDAFPIFDMPELVRTPVGTEVQVPIVAYDPLGDPVTFELSPLAIAHGAQIVDLDLNGDTLLEPVLVYTPPIERITPLELVAFDPAGHTVFWTVNVDAYTESAENRVPWIIDVPDPIRRRDVAMSVTATATDPDRDPLVWSVTADNLPGGHDFAIDADTGVITWTPTVAGNFTVEITVDDGRGGTDTRSVTYTVFENATPQFVSPPLRSGVNGVQYSYDSDAVDPNAGETALLVYDATIQPINQSFGDDDRDWPEVDFAVDPAGGQIDWTPTAAGDYFVTMLATDPHGAVGSQSFFVSVIAPGANNPPDLLTEPAPRYLLSPHAGDQSGVPLDYRASVIDPDNDSLTYELVSGPSGMTVTEDGRVRWTPTGADIGSTGSYTVRVTDGRGGEDSESFTYAVTTDASTTNQSPDFTSAPRIRTVAALPYVYNAEAIDPDGDNVTYALDNSPSGMSIDPVTGLIQWTPTIASLGVHNIVVTATDVAGAASSQTYPLTVVRGDATPQITSTPPVTSVAGDYYHYPVTATDEDGDVLTYFLGAATDIDLPLTLDPVSGILSGTTAVADTYQVEIIAIDPSGRFDSQLYALDVTANDPIDPNDPVTIENNVAPVITSTPPDKAHALEEYSYSFTADDLDIPRGDVLTWTLTSVSPATVDAVNFDTNSQTLSWTPTVAEVDQAFTLEIKVADVAGAYSTQFWSLQIRPENLAPDLQPIADRTLAAGALLAIDTFASDPNNDAITYSVDTVSADRGITIDDLGRLRWQTTAGDLPTSPVDVTVTVSDGTLTDDETFAVTLTADNTPPDVLLTASHAGVDVGEFFDLSVSSADNVGVVSETLKLVSITDFGGNTTTVNETIDLTVTGDARFTTLVEHLGSLTFTATATDATGLFTTSDPLTVLVFDPSDQTAPQVTLLNPVTGDDVPTPTDILGTISDDDSAGLVWSLSIAPADGSAPAREVASGLGEFTAQAIGLFDPTMLRNGSYAITLTATDAGNNTASDTEIVDVTGRLKLGNFSLSFTELEIPVAGIPITIIRTYDTLDAAHSGDFGYGWELEFIQPEMTIDYGTVGAPSFRGYPSFINGTRVTVTTPEGTDEGFTFKWVAASDGLAGIGFSDTYRPSFQPDYGNNYELIPPAADGTFRQLTVNGPYQDDSGKLYSGQDPLFGSAYQLKEIGPGTRGLNYTIFAETLTGTRVSDKYGNELQFRDDGIFSNRGRAVTFQRDARGRITSVTDPNDFKLLYNYDEQGRLVEFYDRRASDRLLDEDPNNNYEPTRFSYDPQLGDEYVNFLTTITDPLGIVALDANYDPTSGRLISLTDAEGNAAMLEYDIENLTVTGTSSSGSTSVALDTDGNPIREVDEAGQVTLTTYHDPVKALRSRVTRVIGSEDTPAEIVAGIGDDLVTSYTYNSYGQRTSETDPRGNTSTTTYDNRGYPSREIDIYGNESHYSFFYQQLNSTADTDGNATGFGYDAFGNVETVSQTNSRAGTSTSTTFDYNNFGDLVETTDPDDNVRTISYDATGNHNGTRFTWIDPLGILPDHTLTTSVVLGPDGSVDSSTDATGQTSTTLYDALGRSYQQIDTNGRTSETIFDKRGLAIETRSESPDEAGNIVELISRTVYDESGRAIYSTGSFPADVFTDNPSEITGTHTIYDPVTSQLTETQQLIGIEIQILSSPSPSSSLASAGTVVSSSRSTYDDANRVTETENDYGLRTQTLYGQFGEVVESRSETVASDGTRSWLVSRSIYDNVGRVTISTGRFLVPGDTPVGEDPATGPVPTQITKTIYDDRGRTIATERYTDALVSLTQLNTLTLSYSPSPSLASIGTLETVSETLYDEAGRVYRTISGRVPQSTISDQPIAISQSVALTDYPIYPESVDRYAELAANGQPLTAGTITDTLFDDRGRQYASLGHPLPASEVGLSGENYNGNLVRIRTETIYDSYGQQSIKRSGLAHVENTDGTFVGIYDNDSVDVKPYYDAFGNVYRTDHITGGTVGVQPLGAANLITTRTGGTLQSYTLTRFDSENRPIAEMQATDGSIVAQWSPPKNSFVIEGTTTHIPTKLYIYDADDRLAAVELPAVANPLNGNTIERPRYEYGYDERGNQTQIIDPLGNETRFTFTDRGQQESRTLPLGFGDDGIFGTTDDPTFTDPNPGSPLPLVGEGPGVRAGTPGSFTEGSTYDDRGRQHLHISFEGIITENVYDSYGRMSGMIFYASEPDYDAGIISEHYQYVYDDYGRRSAVHFREGVTPTAGADPLTFPITRTEQTVYDTRGRVLAEDSHEGVLGYGYDNLGRMTHTAVFNAVADPFTDTPERITSYGYDILGRLVNVQEDATPADNTDDPQIDSRYAFDLLGRQRAQLTFAPGDTAIRTDYDYDALGRLDVLIDRQSPLPLAREVGLSGPGAGPITASYDYTVRADGKRTSSIETFWFDQNEDGTRDAREVKTSTYDWTYDNVGRLTDEILDHWDNNFDQTESFTYDLTGNRVALDRDKGNETTIDEAVAYTYDANDRLLDEVLNSIVDTDDTKTTYAYDHTQQTVKTVATTSTLATRSSQLFSYNLQGRMRSVINEGYDAGGVLNSRERTSYNYDSTSYRISLVTENDPNLDNNFVLASRVSYLASRRNATGYTQTIRETTVENGNTLITDYTFGHDEITQRVRTYSDDSQLPTDDSFHIFGHDGHGSVRVIYDLAGAIEQAFTFSAYGVMIALHNSSAQSIAVTERLSSLGYSGEHFDAKAAQQYLRARFYNPGNGRFNRLDPFAGNIQDPQSLHKYAYVHGDPIGIVDPSGKFGVAISLALGSLGQAIAQGVKAYNDVSTGAAISATLPSIILSTLIQIYSQWYLPSLGNAVEYLASDLFTAGSPEEVWREVQSSGERIHAVHEHITFTNLLRVALYAAAAPFAVTRIGVKLYALSGLAIAAYQANETRVSFDETLNSIELAIEVRTGLDVEIEVSYFRPRGVAGILLKALFFQLDPSRPVRLASDAVRASAAGDVVKAEKASLEALQTLVRDYGQLISVEG